VTIPYLTSVRSSTREPILKAQFHSSEELSWQSLKSTEISFEDHKVIILFFFVFLSNKKKIIEYFIFIPSVMLFQLFVLLGLFQSLFVCTALYGVLNNNKYRQVKYF